MIKISFEHAIHDRVILRELGIYGTVTAYFVGSQGIQYMVDYFNSDNAKLTTYFHPFQLRSLHE